VKTGHTKAKKKTRGKVLLLFGVTAECFEGIEKKDNFISLSSHCFSFPFILYLILSKWMPIICQGLGLVSFAALLISKIRSKNLDTFLQIYFQSYFFI